MPRTKAIQGRRNRDKVAVRTHKCMGARILCKVCHYDGPADIIMIERKKPLSSRQRNRLSLHGMERCPECKSLNIKSMEEPLTEEPEVRWEIDKWTGCYPSNWKGVIVPDAMAHPAKFSSKLIRRIYEHLFLNNWVEAGDSIVDPFGGVALGAFNALEMGLHWTGVELEPKFVELGEHNISHWNLKYKAMPHWSGQAQLLQGDSRRLLDVVNGADAAVSSPPFRQSDGGTPEPKPGGEIDDALYARHAAGNGSAEGYGASDGQLANMKEGDFDGVVSSPPFEQNGSNSGHTGERNFKYTGKYNYTGNRCSVDRYTLPNSDGQLGETTGDDFWMAARQIVEQVYMALKPGGHAVWVCKDFVRNKERVPFSDQWRQLCEAVGFVTLHEHHAMLVRSKGTSMTLDGETVKHETSSKSFFRRLAENKGSPKIDWEVVWCMEKPLE